MAQWLRLHTPNAGGLSSIPGWRTRSHMLQLSVCMPQLEILHATVMIPCAPTKTQHTQIKNINEFFFKYMANKKLNIIKYHIFRNVQDAEFLKN